MTILESLKFIRDNPEKRIVSYGICANLTMVYNPKQDGDKHIKQHKFIASAFSMIYGKDYSIYPIEKGYTEYYLNTNKWDNSTEYGTKRLELLEKMIQVANAMEHLPQYVSIDMLDASDIFGIPVPSSDGTLVWSKPI